MFREYHKWYSPSLNRDMELLQYGLAGRPIIAFPTSRGRFYQNEDLSLINTLWDRIHHQKLQIICVDTLDDETWYNRHVSPWERGQRYKQWEQYIISEVVPFFRARNERVEWELNVTGASFGAYHAINFAFRHPDLVRRIVAMSGSYSLQFLVDSQYDMEVYFNSPVDYLPNLHDDWFLSRMRQQEIILTVGSEDICLGATQQLSVELWAKAVPHHLDIWGGAWHDWPWWKEMALKYFW